ncbi:hypothetical protein FHR89_002954 [Cellulomonas uda]|uniref:Uncharacterized protein n=1 Tax=Cellulomonas uda TaxID=1714 RepID=A0A4Y3KEJ5_CELUD|nr:hypothetical protein [Cellulomonas uda]GEA82373.1 hypothetical protein CUD01_28170 [Cellulomonas uda]
MAVAFDSLFEAECIRIPTMRSNGGWKSIRDVESPPLSTWTGSTTGARTANVEVPPAEFETNHWSPRDGQPYADHASLARAGTR